MPERVDTVETQSGSRAWAAGLSSLVFPGAGLLYLGRWKAALGVALGPALLVSGMMAASTLVVGIMVAAVAASAGVWVASWVGQVVWAVHLARRDRAPAVRRWYSRAWAIALFSGLSWFGARAPLVLLRYFLVEPFVTPTDSMAPALLPGDQFFVVKAGPVARWARGDVLVVRLPGGGPLPLVRRAVGLEGDLVATDAGELILDGAKVGRRPCGEGGWCQWETLPEGRTYEVLDDGDPRSSAAPTPVPASHVYVLGDNRGRSYDSRSCGPVEVSRVIGRAVVVWFSWSPATGVRWSRIGTRLTGDPR